MNGHELSFHLSAHGEILIVGGRASNFDQEYREHEQLIFWYSRDPQTARKQYIPKNIEVIFFTQWIDHSLSTRIKKIAKGKLIQCSWHITELGKIKAFIKNLLRESAERRERERLPEPKAEVPTLQKPKVSVGHISAPHVTSDSKKDSELTITGGGVMTQTTEEAKKEEKKKVGKGVLKKFVGDNADIAAIGYTQEIARLFSLAQEAGINTTPDSISARFSELKRARTGKQPYVAVPKNGRVLRNSAKTLEKFKKYLQSLQDQGAKLVQHVESLEAKNQELEKEAADARELKRKLRAMKGILR